MSATVADLDTKTIENAKREFVELYGSALVMNTYLKIALVLVSLLSLGLLALVFNIQAAASNVKPLVIRVDEVAEGHADSGQRQRAESVAAAIVRHCDGSRSTASDCRKYPAGDHRLADDV